MVSLTDPGSPRRSAAQSGTRPQSRTTQAELHRVPCFNPTSRWSAERMPAAMLRYHRAAERRAPAGYVQVRPGF
jgi:hypothetical protein